MAQSIRNYGDGAMAELVFSKALAIDPGYASRHPARVVQFTSPHPFLHATSFAAALHLRGMLYHGTGQPRKALADCNYGLMLQPKDTNLLWVAATCLHAIGKFREARARYTQLFAADSEHLGYCQREWAMYQW